MSSVVDIPTSTSASSDTDAVETTSSPQIRYAERTRPAPNAQELIQQTKEFLKKYPINRCYSIRHLIFNDFTTHDGLNITEIKLGPLPLYMYVDQRLAFLFKIINFQISSNNPYPKHSASLTKEEQAKNKNLGPGEKKKSTPHVFIHMLCCYFNEILEQYSQKDSLETIYCKMLSEIETLRQDVLEEQTVPEHIALSFRKIDLLKKREDHVSLIEAAVKLKLLYDDPTERKTLEEKTLGDKDRVYLPDSFKKWIKIIYDYVIRHKESLPEGVTIDHINRDSLDNTLCNLRVASKSVQNSNRTLDRAFWNRSQIILETIKTFDVKKASIDAQSSLEPCKEDATQSSLDPVQPFKEEVSSTTNSSSL